MKEPLWLLREVVLAAHEQSLAQFGGPVGVRDEALLESALDKPRNLFVYRKPSLFDLAASYGYGIVKNHPFVDGNKRTGYGAMMKFLSRNGHTIAGPLADHESVFLQLAAGELDREKFLAWIREWIVRK